MATGAPRADELAATLAERVVFVLVRPQHPGNVGATARAMTNMGLRRLVLVDPAPSFDLERVRWMAPGCSETLNHLKIVANLGEALGGIQFAVAATARHRRFHQQVKPPAEWAPLLLERLDDPTFRVAVVFGPESDGLAAADVHLCAGIVRIPTPEHASLNLAQAVLIIAASFFTAARSRGLSASGRTVGGRRTKSTRALSQGGHRATQADFTTMEPAVLELVTLMERIGFTRGTAPDRLAVSARTGLQGSGMTVRHVELIRGMIRRVDWALDNPEADWSAVSSRHRSDD